MKYELNSLDARRNRNINAETELEHRNLIGNEHPEVYRRLKVKYEAERTWIEERIQAINDELAQLNREVEAIVSFQQIKDRFYHRLDELTEIEWRELFIALDLRIHVGQHSEPGSAELRLSSPDVTISYFRGKHDLNQLRKQHTKSTDIEIRIGLALSDSEEPVSNIVFKRPLSFSPPSPLKERGIQGVR